MCIHFYFYFQSGNDSRAEIIRFIDDESGESDSRSFTPSPARSTHNTNNHISSFSSTFGNGSSSIASTIATSLANTFNHVTTSPRKRARSKSVGQLQSIDACVVGSSSCAAVAYNQAQDCPAEFLEGETPLQHVHNLQQLTTVEAFLAFRRSLSLKDGKKVRISYKF